MRLCSSTRKWLRAAGFVLAFAIFLFELLPAGAQAATQTPTPAGRRPVVGLVLSGGGALGATHIGVLKVLEELNVPIDIITGTSMGSIVGGLYAMGLNANELESVVRGIDWAKTFQDSPPRGALPVRRKQEDYGFLLDFKLGIRDGEIQLPAGLIQGQRLTLMMRELTTRTHGITDFDKLPIRFRAVAADLETGQEVILKGGNLATAMRASMSVPGLLPPVELDGRLLVDGGVANNLPADVARAMGAEVLIVVDIPTILKKRDQLTTSLDIAGQMLAVLIQQNSLMQMAALGPQDILIQPDLGTRGSTDFHKIVEMIEPGAAATRLHADRLKALSMDATAYASLAATRELTEVEDMIIDFIEVDNQTKLADKRLTANIRQKIGQPLDVKQLEEDFTLLYGSGLFEQIDYAVIHRDGQTGLQITATEKAWAKDYVRAGLALESDAEGESSYLIGAGLTLTALNAYGAESRSEVAFGSSQLLFTEFYQPLQAETGFYLLPSLRYARDDLRVTGGDGNGSVFRSSRMEAALNFGYELGTELDTRVGLRVGKGDVDLRSGSGAGGAVGDYQIGSIDTRLLYDTLDNVRFPNEGSLVRASLGASQEALGADDDYTKFDMSAAQALSWDDNTVIFGGGAGTALSGELPTYDRFQIGGLFSLSGYTRNELSTANMLQSRFLYMRRLTERAPLFFDLPVYAGASVEAARIDSGSEEDDFDRNAFGSSLFLGADTPLGAAYLALGQGDGGRRAAYLYFGRLF